MIRRASLLLLSLTLLVTAVAPAALAQEADAPVQSPFPDTRGIHHEQAIVTLAQVGVTSGLADGNYGPGLSVRRDQMASFLRNARQYAPQGHGFRDVPQHGASSYPHAGAIGALASNNITEGCDRDDPGLYCPSLGITRAQFASMLTRAFELSAADHPTFQDVTPGTTHAPAISAIAAAGITSGCGGGNFCPDAEVRRDQMATLLVAALELGRPVPCPMIDGNAQFTNTTRLAAPIGYPVTAGHWFDGQLVLFPNDLQHRRAARLQGTPASPELVSTFNQPAGRRTWATTEARESLYYGVWGEGGNNLFRAGSGIGTRVEVGTEFWDLTADGHVLYVAGKAWTQDGALLLPDEAPDTDVDDRQVIHRVATNATGFGTPERVLFRLPEADGFPYAKADTKHVAVEGDQLFVAFGPASDGARVVSLDLDDLADPQATPDDLPQATDLTPASVQGKRDVFAFEVTEDWIVIGTYAGLDDPARLVVLDRDAPTAPPVLDVALDAAESRVDAVAVAGNRIVAAGFPTGALYVTDTSSGQVVRRAAPEANTTTRALRIDGNHVEGVSGRGDWWRVPLSGGSGASVDVSDLGPMLSGSGRVHSLGGDDDHVYVGASNRVFAHPNVVSTPSPAPITGDIGGEVKSIATHAGTAYLATYPSAELSTWRPGNGQPSLLASWNPDFNRPRAVTVADNGWVYVVAREDRPDGPDASQLVVIDPTAPVDQRVRGEYPLTHPGGDVEGLTVAAVGGRAIIGDVAGEVRAIDARTGRQVWRHRVWPTGEPRPIRNLEVVDGRLVVVDAAGRWAEIAIMTGSVLRSGSHGSLLVSGDVWDSVTFGPVTVTKQRQDLVGMDRSADRIERVARHGEGRTFASDTPLVADSSCRMHMAVGEFLQTLPYDPKTRLTSR